MADFVAIEFNTRDLEDELMRIARRAQHQRDINFQISEVMLFMVEDKFDKEGPGWEPLAPATILRRRGGTRILQDSGLLASSMTPFADDERADVYTNVGYAGFHLDGTDNMPQRDFFDIDMERLLEIAAGMIMESIGEQR